MLSPRHERIGFISLFLASCVAFGTGFVLAALPLVAVGFFGALGGVLWGAWATRPTAASAPVQPEREPETPVPFEIVEPAPAEADVTFHVVEATPPVHEPAPAPAANPLPWARPTASPALAVTPTPVGAAGGVTAVPKPEWARATSAVGGGGTRMDDAPARPAAPRFNHLGAAVTRGACGKCRTPLTLSARRPIRATCPMCGHSRVLE